MLKVLAARSSRPTCYAARPRMPVGRYLAVTGIVPYAAGECIPETGARLTAEHLQRTFKQSFIIQNETGAGGMDWSRLRGARKAGRLHRCPSHP